MAYAIMAFSEGNVSLKSLDSPHDDNLSSRSASQTHYHISDYLFNHFWGVRGVADDEQSSLWQSTHTPYSFVFIYNSSVVVASSSMVVESSGEILIISTTNGFVRFPCYRLKNLSFSQPRSDDDAAAAKTMMVR